MRTTKPISTISYNSADYLRVKLNELQKAKRISFWAFISHKAEDDEAGSKNHHHVYIMPSRMLQTDDLRDELKEFDPFHPSNPLGVMPFHTSKFDDWYLYVTHDKAYLSSKGQTRKFHYSHSDFATSESDYLLFLARNIDRTALTPYETILDAQARGYTWAEFFSSHSSMIPIQQIGIFEKAWKLLLESKTYRNGRDAHLVLTEDGKYLLPSTGEIFESIKDFEERNSDDKNENGTS